MLSAQLRLKKRSRYFRFLIDSGADFTMLSKADALLIGLSYERIPAAETVVECADLKMMHVKKVTLKMDLEGLQLKIPVMIAKEHVECLLGRKGVFEHFDILFQESKQQVVFSKNS